jgi:putative redox protein
MAKEIATTVVQAGPSASEARIRHHRVMVDRPESGGGSDQGPMGGELFLAALGGCFMSNLLAAAKTRETAISDARVELVGTLVEGPMRYASITMLVSATCGHADMLAKLVEIADRGCIMTNTLRGVLPVTVSLA